jgi:hypothetical protein
VSVVVNITAGIIGSRLFPRSRPTA